MTTKQARIVEVIDCHHPTLVVEADGQRHYLAIRPWQIASLRPLVGSEMMVRWVWREKRGYASFVRAWPVGSELSAEADEDDWWFGLYSDLAEGPEALWWQ